ncbi:MAG: choice-of-anchor G family protein [Schumannella sp.]
MTTIAAALAVATATLFAGVGPATAATGDSSYASGQLLSGSLIGSDLSVLASLAGTEATSDGSADVVDTGSLSVAVLQALQLEVAGGLQVPLNAVDLGVIGQYAAANADASSLGAVGAVASDGAIGVGPVGPGGAPTAFEFDLGSLLATAGVDASAVGDLHLQLGAVSAQAAADAVTAPTGDYEIAGLRLAIDSQAVRGISAAARTAVDGVVDPLVSDLVGSGSGSLLSAVGAAAPGLTLGVLGAGASVDVDLDAALAPLIGAAAPPLGVGSPIEVDLGTGIITVDIRALLESDSDPTNDLNSLAPNTEVLSAAVLAMIADGVESLIDDLVDDIAAAVVTAVQSAAVAVDLSVTAPILGNVATIHVAGTVAQLLASAPGTVSVDVLNASICVVPVLGDLVCSTLEASALSAVAGVLASATSGLLNDVLDDVQADVVVPLLALLDPALAGVVTGIVSLRVNVQEPAAPAVGDVFAETALRLTLLSAVLPGGGAAVLNLSRAVVGPNTVAGAVGGVTITSGPAGPAGPAAARPPARAARWPSPGHRRGDCSSPG